MLPEIRRAEWSKGGFVELLDAEPVLPYNIRMDPLSEALRSVPIQGSHVARAEVRAPWKIRVDRNDAAVFHLVVSGSCRLQVETGQKLELEAGDIAVLMRGQAHALFSEVAAEPAPFAELLSTAPGGSFPTVQIGGDGVSATILCGYFTFDRGESHPLLRRLPDVVHVNSGSDPGLLQGLLATVDAESAAARPGSTALVEAMCGLILVHMLRAHLSADPRESAPWIHGIKDRRIGMAIELMHANPAKDWTVRGLAEQVAMSRSSFSTRFLECVGETPMKYLARCRIMRAAHQLGTQRLTVSEVMHQVGYRSESSFTKAFRKTVGRSPASYRTKAKPAARAS